MLKKQIQQILILKGYETVVANQNEYYVNKTGNSGMATAGSGDVLTGLLASLSAQGLAPYEASCAAVYLHGKAGDKAYQNYGIGLTASDLTKYFGSFLK